VVQGRGQAGFRQTGFSESNFRHTGGSRKPGLPYARSLVGSCQGTPRARKHYQHEGKDKAYGLYCDKGFESG
jgi:hypothetical protein